jgi:outer membrane protein assembly factor BamA
VSFDREELGVNLGARRRITGLGADAALRYQFEAIRAEVFDPDAATEAPTDSNVATLTFDLTRDRRDNPILPRRGYFLALSLETATEAIGGEVNYQRLDLRGAWHRRVGREQYLHVGLRHGVLWALRGSAAADIPLAKRYFPGGEGTVRGYLEGRAAPRASDGTVIGAEISTVVNIEFEQGLARDLSAVLFVDAGVTAAALADYPGDETRVSVGLGLRFNTVIGPARLEYGHNLVRETGDGRDAWHFALGFPF